MGYVRTIWHGTVTCTNHRWLAVRPLEVVWRFSYQRGATGGWQSWVNSIVFYIRMFRVFLHELQSIREYRALCIRVPA